MMRLTLLRLFAAVVLTILFGGSHAQACEPTFKTSRGEVVRVIRGLPTGVCEITNPRTITADTCPSLTARAEPAKPKFAGTPPPGKKRWHLVCLVWSGDKWIDAPNRRD